MIAGVVKGFGFSLDYVLNELSYANLVMLGATLPSYDRRRGHEDRHARGEETIDASDPRNRERVRDILNSID